MLISLPSATIRSRGSRTSGAEHRAVTTLARIVAGLTLLAAPGAAGATCSVSPQSVSFGAYDPLSPSALDGVGNVNVACDAPTNFTVSLDSGNGTVEDRRMTGGPADLDYNLYKESARVIIWGEAAAGVSSSGTNVDLPVYGRIPGGQNVPANIYADSVTVTVAF